MQDQYGRDVQESVELGWLVYSGTGNTYTINPAVIDGNPAEERARVEKAVQLWLDEYKSGSLPKLRDIIDGLTGAEFDDMPLAVKVHWYFESGIEARAARRLIEPEDWACVL